MIAELRRIQSHVLGHPFLDPPADLALADTAIWSELLAWSDVHRLQGQVFHALAPLEQLGAHQRRVLSERMSRGCAISLHVDASLPSVAGLLDRAGIDWRLMKGCATSRVLYPDESWRHYGDADVLVRLEHFEDAKEALRPLVAVPAPVQAGPLRTLAAKEHAFVDHRGVEIDLHFAVQGSLLSSRVDNDLLFASPTTIEVQGRQVPTMSNGALLVNAVLHLSSAGGRLSTVPDIVRLARLVAPDDSIVAELLAAERVRRLFTWALGQTLSWVSLPAPWVEWEAQHRNGRCRQPAYGWLHRRDERIRIVNTFVGPQRLRRAAEWLWPSREFLDAHGINRLQNLSGGLAVWRRAGAPDRSSRLRTTKPPGSSV